MSMKLILIILVFPSIAFGDCEVMLSEIKPHVRKYLAPLHKTINIFISEEQFKNAYEVVSELELSVNECREYHRQFELDNYDYKRWGEKSDKYHIYSNELFGITMQLKAGYKSHELGLLRPFLFKIGMWEKVVNEFYEREI